MAFFESIFASIVASCVFEGTSKLIDMLKKNKSFDEKLKDAFACAVHKYFKDPLQQEKVIFHDTDKYIIRLKKELNEESNIQDSEKYRGLYSYFEKEIIKCPSLLGSCVFFYIKTGRKLMKQYKDEILLAINSSTYAVNDKIGGIEKQLIQLMNFNTLPIFSLDENIECNHNSIKLPEHISYRDSIVERLCTDLQQFSVLLIYGTRQCGKSTLARLVTHKLKTQYETILIDCKDSQSFQYIKFSIQQHLKSDASLCFVFDNVLQDHLLQLVDYSISIQNNHRIIITTSKPYDIALLTNNESVMTQYEVPSLSESEVLEIVNSYHPNRDVDYIVSLAASHHPILVHYLCLYLRSHKWEYDEVTIKNIISGEYLKSQDGYISELIETSLHDSETIHLLNRLLLFQSLFTENDVEELANISPVISQPRLRFQHIKPLWLTNSNNNYQVTPLLHRLWKPDLLQQEKIDCNKHLGDAILRKKNITDIEAIQAIMYYQNAGLYDYAGEIYVKIIYSTDSLPKRSLLNILWMGVPLPIQMRAELRFIIRAGQILRFRELGTEHLEYLYKDIQTIVEEECVASHMAHIIYHLMSSISFVKDDIENALRYHRISKSLWPKEIFDDTNFGESLNKYAQSNIWTLLLRVSNWQDLNKWVAVYQETNSKDFQLTMLEYTSCNLFVWQFIDRYSPNGTLEERLNLVNRLYEIVKDYHINELSIMIRFKQVELFNNYKQYDQVYEKAILYLQEYANQPLADLVFNAAIGYAYYRDDRYDDKTILCLKYLNNAILPEGVDMLPDVQLHVMELRSYVLSSHNTNDALNAMQMAYDYVEEPKHRIEPYDYYFAKGELALAKWLAGEQHGSLQDISDCLEYVLTDLNKESKFGKTYLCKLGCLLVKCEHDINNTQLPPEQASPVPGMFTEFDAQGFDDLYDERRLFTTAVIMYLLAVKLNDITMINKWMNKSIAMCMETNELKAEFGICVTMLPYLLKNGDFDKYIEMAKLSYRADQLVPNHNSKEDDISFITLKLLPLVILAINKIITEKDYSLYQSLSRRIHSFEIGKNSVAVQRVAQILSTPIAEVDHNLLEGIDANSHYEVYMIVYLIMLLKEDSTKNSFMICFFLLKFAQPQCRKIYQSSIDWLFDDFVYNFWQWKLANKSDEFENVTKLLNEGFKAVNDTEIDKAKKCLEVVSYHVRGLDLSIEQEDFLYK